MKKTILLAVQDRKHVRKLMTILMEVQHACVSTSKFDKRNGRILFIIGIFLVIIEVTMCAGPFPILETSVMFTGNCLENLTAFSHEMVAGKDVGVTVGRTREFVGVANKGNELLS